MSLKVIYLDDEPALCEIFSDEFGSDEIVIATYTDPKLAIEAVKQAKPDVVFVDYRLPEMNCDEVALAMPASIAKYLVTGEPILNSKYKFNGVFGKPLDRVGIRAVFAAMQKRAA